MRLVTRTAAIAAAVAVLALVTAAPAAAHVTVDPDVAYQGGSARVAFLAPTEGQDAATVELAVHMPDDVAMAGVSVVPVPGWSVEITRVQLDEPVVDHHGVAVDEAVSHITWRVEDEEAAIAPGEVGQFTVLFGSLPHDEDQLVFRALQTYSDGEVVRWIEPPEPDGSEPPYPGPILALEPGGGGHHGHHGHHDDGHEHDPGPADNSAAGEPAATGGADGSDAVWLPLAGFAAGLGGLALGGLALIRTGRGARGSSGDQSAVS